MQYPTGLLSPKRGGIAVSWQATVARLVAGAVKKGAGRAVWLRRGPWLTLRGEVALIPYNLYEVWKNARFPETKIQIF